MTSTGALPLPAAARSTAPPRTLTGLTVFGCRPDEAELFRGLAPRFGVQPLILTAAPVSEETAPLAAGMRSVSVDHRSRVTNPTLTALSRVGVRYLSARSIGVDHIDTGFADALGLRVEAVAYSPDSVADHAVLHMLMLLRDAPSALRRVAAGDYRLGPILGRELRDLTVGVIGTGRIGAAVIERLHGFGATVLAHDTRPKVAAEYVPLGELLLRSDIVTLHVPLTDATHHLLDRERIAETKRGALVINTARGGLIDTPALVVSLESGQIGGAALDVIEGEKGIFAADRRHSPVPHTDLLRLQSMPNVIVTPHSAYFTDHALRDTIEGTLAACARVHQELRDA